MSGSGKEVLGMVGISQDEVGAGTFPDKLLVIGLSPFSLFISIFDFFSLCFPSIFLQVQFDLLNLTL